MATYTCGICGHTATNYPTSGYVDEHGAHHREDSEQAHARMHTEMAALGIDPRALGFGA